jgi:hypothetical protein
MGLYATEAMGGRSHSNMSNIIILVSAVRRVVLHARFAS